MKALHGRHRRRAPLPGPFASTGYIYIPACGSAPRPTAKKKRAAALAARHVVGDGVDAWNGNAVDHLFRLLLLHHDIFFVFFFFVFFVFFLLIFLRLPLAPAAAHASIPPSPRPPAPPRALLHARCSTSHNSSLDDECQAMPAFCSCFCCSAIYKNHVSINAFESSSNSLQHPPLSLPPSSPSCCLQCAPSSAFPSAPSSAFPNTAA